MRFISIRILWAALGGGLIGAALQFALEVHFAISLLSVLGLFLIYEARWMHYDWMYPKWMLDL